MLNRPQILKGSDLSANVLTLRPAAVDSAPASAWSEMRSGEKRRRRLFMVSIIALVTAGAVFYCSFVLMISKSLLRSVVFSVFSR